jgi:hypothetical protein
VDRDRGGARVVALVVVGRDSHCGWPAAASVPSSGTANPARSPNEPAASKTPNTGTHDRGTRFMSAWAFGYS